MSHEQNHLVHKVSSLVADMEGESERGVALVAANYLDDQLATLLKAFLIDEPSEVDDMFILRAPLGDFDSKIRMSYCLGLITQQEYHDIQIIRKIRNLFAHQTSSRSFENQNIKDRCHNFILLTEQGTINIVLGLQKDASIPADFRLNNIPRARFTLLTAILCLALDDRARNIERTKAYTNGLVQELIF